MRKPNQEEQENGIQKSRKPDAGMENTGSNLEYQKGMEFFSAFSELPNFTVEKKTNPLGYAFQHFG